jgi:hypothetical protein
MYKLIKNQNKTRSQLVAHVNFALQPIGAICGRSFGTFSGISVFFSTISLGTLSGILQNSSWEILLHCFASRSMYSQWLVTLLIAVFLLIQFE